MKRKPIMERFRASHSRKDDILPKTNRQRREVLLGAGQSLRYLQYLLTYYHYCYCDVCEYHPTSPPSSPFIVYNIN